MPFSSPEEKKVVQIGVVVEDLERTAAAYRDILGFDVPEEYQHTQAHSTYHGEPADAPAKFIHFMMGDVAFRLLQPTGEGSIWMDFLKRRGAGIHHVSFSVSQTSAAVAAFAEHGCAVMQQGMFGGQGGMYTYLDTERDLGVAVELLEYFDAVPQHEALPFPADRGIGTNIVQQVGLVVEDIERCAARYRAMLDLPEPNWVQTPGYAITETTFMGQPSEATAKLAFFNLGQAQIELIQPDDTPSVWRNYLNHNGDSAHHIAFQVQNTERAVEHFASHGIGVAQQGLYGDRRGIYTYMDSEATLGIIIELLESFSEPR